MKELLPQEALLRVAALCSRSEQAPQDIREKLSRWGVPETAAASILKQLTQEGYLDENRFCRSFVHDKFRYNGWGRIKIRYALQQKKCGTEAIAAALDTLDETEYREALKALLQGKKRGAKAPLSRPETARLIRFALSRGYEYDVIRNALPEAGEV